MHQYPCSVVPCMCVEYLGKKASFFSILLCSVSSIPVDGTMWYGEHFSWQAFSQLAPMYVHTHTHTDTKRRYAYNIHTCMHMRMHACMHTHMYTQGRGIGYTQSQSMAVSTPLHVRMYTCTYSRHVQQTCRHHERLQPSELHFECVICIKFRSKRDTTTL